MLTVGDLFSGIGGFALGLERAGMRTRWFAEVDPFASAVLRRHWPDVPNHGDVRSIRAELVEPVDVVCGGFPCQDVSVAGSGRGLDGERSGLWSEFARIVGDLRPRYAIVENVGALAARGLSRVLGDLTALGYDAEWHLVPAAAVGAPHLRDRCWIIARDAADSDGDRLRHDEQREARRRVDVQDRGNAEPVDDGAERPAADAHGRRRERQRLEEHGDEQGAPGCQPDGLGERRRRDGATEEGRWPDRLEVAFAPALARLLGRDDADARAFWEDWPPESPLRGMDDGVPARLDRGRLACLGNAVVPQIVEMIGRAIIESERML